VWDTIGTEQGVDICMNALSKKPGSKYGTILFNTIPRQDVTYTNSVLVTIFNEPIDIFGKHWPANAEDFEFAKMFSGLTERLLTQGDLKPHPGRAGERGLQGILEGVELLAEGKVSGVKLVYRVDETPSDE